MRLALVAFGCCLAVATVLRAQEPAVEEETEERVTTEGTESTEAREVGAPAAEEKEAVGEQERKTGVVGATPGRFEPTEKVRADFDVSFPVDI